jgi:hypothetical protein
MKHLRLFETEADYNAATLDLPVVSYVKKTGNVYYNGKHAVDRVLNAPLMNMCVANGWAKESNDYLTYEEAAVVPSINMTDFATYEVVSAWELKYFTGITSFTQSQVKLPLIEYFYIPDTYTGGFSHSYSGSGGYLFPNIRKYHISDSMTTIRSEKIKSSTNFSGSIVYLGKNITKTAGAPIYPFCQFETVIFAAEPIDLNAEQVSSIGAQHVFIADENVETLKTLEPFKRYKNSIFPLSEYIGDTDY